MEENKETRVPLKNQKQREYTTIQITIETHAKLHSLKRQLEKILRKKTVSFDQLFDVMLAVRPLDVLLQEYILEDATLH